MPGSISSSIRSVVIGSSSGKKNAGRRGKLLLQPSEAQPQTRRILQSVRMPKSPSCRQALQTLRWRSAALRAVSAEGLLTDKPQEAPDEELPQLRSESLPIGKSLPVQGGKPGKVYGLCRSDDHSRRR